MTEEKKFRSLVRKSAGAVIAVMLVAGACTGHAQYITYEASPDRFPLAGKDAVADIYVAENDWKVARIAANDLAADLERVTGRLPAVKHSTDGLGPLAVWIGTLGHSPVIDGLVEAGKLDVTGTAGEWESFVMQVVADPLPGVASALVIAGSDRRGTAFGVYELSRKIGVSPWYWWADVTPQRQAGLHVSPERHQVGPPAVKYRGIFINDEMWGLRPWAHGTFAPDEGFGIGPKTHAKIFELLLRLRANHLWPAMHRHTIPFNTYPENKRVADDYAITMGSSHIEPMLRNTMHGAEWDREGRGEWDYLTNRDEIYDYWEQRVIENGGFENIYTIGMRGKDDEAIYSEGTAAEKVALLERIFADQREILTRHIDPDPAAIPQVFIPYTEVLHLYDSGMKVPDDVIICWPDDNFGYIRRLPTAEERARPGGSGVYYHIQWLNGATTAYTWLNTMPLPLIFTEMYKSWQHEARELWVLNVGDIKPGEIGTEFFLEMAWDPERWADGDTRRFLVNWAARDLDARFAGEIADIMEEYFQLGFARRPEHLVQFQSGKPLSYSWFSHDHHGDEAGRRLERYAAIAARAEAIYQEIPPQRKAAYFQLVLYPVRCAALMNQKVIHAELSMRDAGYGRASARAHAKLARTASERIIELTEIYNTDLPGVGDKWRHMMSWAPGPWGNQRHQFEMPPLSDFDGIGAPTLQVVAEGGGEDAVADMSVFTRRPRFIDLFNTGQGPLEWRATASQPWLIADRESGTITTHDRIWLSIDWDAAPHGADLEAALDIESPGGDARITVPVFHPMEPKRDGIRGFVESHGHVSMRAGHFTRSHARGGAEWRSVPKLGREGDAITIFPSTVDSRTEAGEIRAHSPSVEYDMHLFSTGSFELHIDGLPTQPVSPDRGVRFAVSLNDGELILLGEQPRRYPDDVLTNLRRSTTILEIDRPGLHTLTVWMVDPGVIIDKLILHTREPAESYLGPRESFRR